MPQHHRYYTNTNRIYLLGSGTYDIESHLPRGTIFLQGEVVPSGHLVIPSDSYAFEIGELPGGDSNTTAETAATFPDHGGEHIIPDDDTFTGNMSVEPPTATGSQDSQGTSNPVVLQFRGEPAPCPSL